MILRNVLRRRRVSVLPSSRFQYRILNHHFHTSQHLTADIEPQDHYATLDLRYDASPSDIKKSFYKLSKTYHPDHNPDNPEASRRFMRISEAYHTLGHADKRAVYDRDVLGRQRHVSGTNRPRGSYHSTGPAGGRPASGLSRRRGTFQGPPPSFYRSGGWGAQGAKRRTAHDESTGGAGGDGAPRRKAGMGYGQDPYGNRDDVPHFDRVAHQKTGERVAERRTTTSQRGEKIETEGGLIANFFVVAGILVIAVATPVMVFGGRQQSRKKPAHGEG
jgi:DnaJ-class molecular chaperone